MTKAQSAQSYPHTSSTATFLTEADDTQSEEASHSRAIAHELLGAFAKVLTVHGRPDTSFSEKKVPVM